MDSCEISNLTATESLLLKAQGRIQSREFGEACLNRIESLDDEIRAWVEWDKTADHKIPSSGPISGVPIAVKDIFHVCGFSTGYGAEYFGGINSRYDGAVVAQLRKAGAYLIGKTVTAEFAYLTPGPTCNPHCVSCTPGGSSSGSAAAVAAGMVPIALGTQTAASIIRPASFCGVIGFKPSHGILPMDGILQFSNSLDTPGYFARSIADIALIHGELMNFKGWLGQSPFRGPRAVGIQRLPSNGEVDGDMVRAIEAVAGLLEDAGVRVEVAPLPPKFDDLVAHHQTIIAYEGARSLFGYYQAFGRDMSPELISLVERGLGCSEAQYICARIAAQALASELDGKIGQYDFFMGPAAPGGAPPGLSTTGNPVYSRAWTVAGLPALSLPLGTSDTGLPLGIQLVGQRFRDFGLLKSGDWVLRRLIGEHGIVPTANLPAILR